MPPRPGQAAPNASSACSRHEPTPVNPVRRLGPRRAWPGNRPGQARCKDKQEGSGGVPELVVADSLVSPLNDGCALGFAVAGNTQDITGVQIFERDISVAAVRQRGPVLVVVA